MFNMHCERERTCQREDAKMDKPAWTFAVAVTCAMAASAFAQQINRTGGSTSTRVSSLPSQRIVNERAQGSGVFIGLSPSRVRLVQQTLNRLGYNAGHLTGSWTRLSASALTNFQQAHGLEPTGTLNFSSIAALGLWKRVIGDPLVGTQTQQSQQSSKLSSTATVACDKPQPNSAGAHLLTLKTRNISEAFKMVDTVLPRPRPAAATENRQQELVMLSLLRHHHRRRRQLLHYRAARPAHRHH